MHGRLQVQHLEDKVGKIKSLLSDIQVVLRVALQAGFQVRASSLTRSLVALLVSACKHSGALIFLTVGPTWTHARRAHMRLLGAPTLRFKSAVEQGRPRFRPFARDVDRPDT
jgi:hypothetical protein